MKSLFVLLVLVVGFSHCATPSNDVVREVVHPTTSSPEVVPIDAKISIDELITIGKTIWQVIKDGKPVVNYQVDWAGEEF